MRKGMRSNLEPFVIVILIAITVIEFLLLAGGLKYNKFVEALIAMVLLMMFGSSLLLISIVARIHDLVKVIFIEGVKIRKEDSKNPEPS
ncbi:MAG: hypothetical protein GXN99_00825, partial [Candidatus Nanohaloarchaeota archaeon]|nr:hypothetical protein [Candidatus Nanohaloarchaeota archaeon]